MSETLDTATLDALAEHFDAVLLDVGNTLVVEAEPGTPVGELVPEPLPGVVEAVRHLASRRRVGAVTNAAVMREADVRALLARVDLDRHLDVVVTSADAGAAKPDPRPLTLALERLGVAPARALFVGDRAADEAAAAAAGTAFRATDAGLVDALVRAVVSREGAFANAAAGIRALDEDAVHAAARRQGVLTKPSGSLGRLEQIAAQLCGIAGRCPAPVPTRPAVAVFAADHGVAASGVTPWPQTVTAQMVANFAAGGAAINVIARQVGAAVRVVDVGVAGDLGDVAGVEDRRVRPGTADLSVGPAMTARDARAALDAGAEVAAALVADGYDLLLTGDMGIGNSTASAALIGALTGRPAADVTGRGSGIDDAMLDRKTAVVAGATERVAGYLDPTSVLAAIGGLEIAAIAGFAVGGAAAGVPVVVDGLIALAGVVVGAALVPDLPARCIAGHRSTEPGATVALDHLALAPVLDLELRLGEGTGACLAVPLVQAAARTLAEMATFEDAAVDRGPAMP